MKKILFLIAFFSMNLFYSQKKEFIDLIFNNKENFRILEIFKGKIPKQFLILNQTSTFSESNFHLTNLELSEPEKSDEHSRFLNSYLFRNEELNQLINEKEKIRLGVLSKNSKSITISSISNKNIRIISNKNITKKFYFQISEPIYTEKENYAFVLVDIYNFDKYYVSKDNDGYYFYGYIIFTFKKLDDTNWKIISNHERLIM